jgi:hypothetical protein
MRLKEEQKKGRDNARFALYPLRTHVENSELYQLHCTLLMDYMRLSRAQVFYYTHRWRIFDYSSNEAVSRLMTRVTENVNPANGLHKLTLTEKDVDYFVEHSRDAIENDLQILAFYHWLNREHFTKAVKPYGLKVNQQFLAAGRVNFETRYHFKPPMT